MAKLQDCTDEVLLYIIYCVHLSEDLINLSKVCSRFKRLVSLFRKDCSLFGELSDIFIRFPRNVPAIPFRHILERPQQLQQLCRHVIEAQLRFKDHIASNDNNDFRYKLSASEETQFLERALNDLRVSEWENGKALLEGRSSGGTGYFVAIFLLLLINLEKLQLEVLETEDVFWIHWVIRELSRSGPPPALPFPRQTFGFHALREVKFTSKTIQGVTVTLEDLAPFLLLPSMRKISSREVCQTEEFKWDGAYNTSSVTELDFGRSFICAQALEEFLRIPKSLSNFRYEYLSGNDTEDGDPMDEEHNIGNGIQGDVDEDFDYNAIEDIVRRTQQETNFRICVADSSDSEEYLCQTS